MGEVRLMILDAGVRFCGRFGRDGGVSVAKCEWHIGAPGVVRSEEECRYALP